MNAPLKSRSALRTCLVPVTIVGDVTLSFQSTLSCMQGMPFYYTPYEILILSRLLCNCGL